MAPVGPALFAAEWAYGAILGMENIDIEMPRIPSWPSHRSGVNQVVSVGGSCAPHCAPPCPPVCNPCGPVFGGFGGGFCGPGFGFDGRRDHHDGGCHDRSLTHDSIIRELEACCRWERDAIEHGITSVTDHVTTAATAGALAASNTDKLVLQGQTQAVTLAAQAAAQAASNFATLQLQAASNFAALQLQAAKDTAAVLMATEKSKCEIEKLVAECCCETKALIIAEADRTRQQSNDFRIRDLERAVDRLTPPVVAFK